MGWGDSLRAENWLDDVESIELELRRHTAQPQLICSSALGRARHCAEYFASRFGVDILPPAPELNEINYGMLYGKSKDWAAQHYPMHKRDPDFVYPDGESFNQLQSRTVAHIQSLTQSHAGQILLCVAHAGVVRALLCHFLDLDYAAHLKSNVSHRYIGVLDFNRADCVSYDEWGKPSGFVNEGAVDLPHTPKIA